MLLFASGCTTIYIPESQHPHRKDLKLGMKDDIIKLLNETAAPVQEGLFSEMGLQNKNTHAGVFLL